MPSVNASWRANSVLPTPVGPVNKNEPIGLSVLPKPARVILIAEDTASMALFCPNTVFFKSRSRYFNLARASVLTVFGGMRAIFAINSSISILVIFFLRCSTGNTRCAAPASSIKSIALSGKNRSFMYLADNSAAAIIADGAYLT